MRQSPAHLRLCIAQLGTTVGDLDGNCQTLAGALEIATAAGADLFIAPELAICGYPPEDLLGMSGFVEDCQDHLSALAPLVGNMTAFIGLPVHGEPIQRLDARPRDLYNAVAIIVDGKVAGYKYKHLLPDYDIFDESRRFGPGPADPQLIEVGGAKVALAICEDLWTGAYATAAAKAGAQAIVSVNASPWDRAKRAARFELASKVTATTGLCLAYVNLVGAQDGVVFDGSSFVACPDGTMSFQAPSFRESVSITSLSLAERLCQATRATGPAGPAPSLAPAGVGHDGQCQARPRSAHVGWAADEAEIWAALGLGLSDYLTKNGFDMAWIGLSGGIDSAVTATLAVDALGASAVKGLGTVRMFH